MQILKILLLAVTSFSLIGDAAPQIKKGENRKMSETKVDKTDENSFSASADEEIKYIAEGAYSKVEKPFVFVARTPETYAHLQDLVENLPRAADVDFQKNAVVAAFAGTKKTGGYSVAIKKTAGKILLEVVEPPKDAMTTQALTTPFGVALVAVEPEMNLLLEFSKDWKTNAQNFKVTKGDFVFSGGFTGRAQTFKAAGAIQIFSYKELATLVFNLSGKGTEMRRKLSGAASGTYKKGKIDLSRLDGGSFSEAPKPPVKVSGKLTQTKLTLAFESLPSTVADAYQLGGNLEAVKTK